MRIEFTTETESLEGLHLIRQAVDHAIEMRKAQMAHFAERVKAGWDANGSPVVDERTGETVGRVISATIVDPAPKEAFRKADDPALACAARAAFGGGGNVLPFPVPANSATAPATSTANPISAPAVAPPAAAVANAAAVSAAVNSSPTPPASTTAPGTASPAGTVEFDAKGIPWDARIHSEARTRNNDGTWRYKRKLDDATKAAVLAEIAATGGTVAHATNNVSTSPGIPPVPPPPPPAMAAAPVSLPPPVPVPVPAPVRMPDANVAGVVPQVNPTVAGTATPSASGPATTAQSVTVIASPSKVTFRDLIVKLNKALAAGTLTQEALAFACLELGIGESPAALGSPDYAHLTDVLDAKLFATG